MHSKNTNKRCWGTQHKVQQRPSRVFEGVKKKKGISLRRLMFVSCVKLKVDFCLMSVCKQCCKKYPEVKPE